ncbi:MAG: fibrobacter succinogenes major paralogous domain-containing protein [Bacteroidetes bacterium]|nr:fibrobacter succinogenes major paralogous domain-containing protein [Bacteroidota bacterium]MCL2301667.1 fibrobacter succinogenes major paralogous domain-containing protein [Lentimicrobiaceae bacterium]
MKRNRIYLFISITILFASACNKLEKEYVAPKVYTKQPTEVTITEASLVGTFTKGSENITVFGFEWKEANEEAWQTINAQANNGIYSSTIINLKEDTEYVVKAFIIDASNNRVEGEESRFFTNGTLTDIDGNTYLTLRYGRRVWMIENLRVTHFADGTPVEGRAGGANSDSDGPVYFHSAFHTPHLRDPNFGFLYNWAAAARAKDCEIRLVMLPFSHHQGICPDGWHLPSTGEWGELIAHCGGFENAGAVMKTSTWAESINTTSNPSRFSIEPAGWYYYDADRSFRGVFSSARFWTNTQAGGCCLTEGEVHSFGMVLLSDIQSFYSLSMLKSAGYSVRCVKNVW